MCVVRGGGGGRNWLGIHSHEDMAGFRKSVLKEGWSLISVVFRQGLHCTLCYRNFSTLEASRRGVEVLASSVI